MKIRFDGNEQKLLINQEQNFKTDAGWEESFQVYEDEVLRSIINPIENYETSRYIHKPYTSNGISQSDIWFYFNFVKNGSYNEGIDYGPEGIEQSDINLTHLKNSFFKLEFYKTPNNESPNRSNRRLVFSKTLNPVVGEKVTLDSGQQMYVPVFKGTSVKNKENMYLFWFEDDSVLEETDLTGTTFYMTAKFYNSVYGTKTQFVNKVISSSASVVEEDDLYFIVEMDRSNEPKNNYIISEYDSTSGTGSRVGTSTTPIQFYEIGGVYSTPTPTPQVTPSPTPPSVITPTPTGTPQVTPTPSDATPMVTFSGNTSVYISATLPGDDPATGSTTGTLTVINGTMSFKVNSYKPFNYDNISKGRLEITGIGYIEVTNPTGTSSTVTSTSQLNVPPGTYHYTLYSIVDFYGTLTFGVAEAQIVQV